MGSPSNHKQYGVYTVTVIPIVVLPANLHLCARSCTHFDRMVTGNQVETVRIYEKINCHMKKLTARWNGSIPTLALFFKEGFFMKIWQCKHNKMTVKFYAEAALSPIECKLSIKLLINIICCPTPHVLYKSGLFH